MTVGRNTLIAFCWLLCFALCTYTAYPARANNADSVGQSKDAAISRVARSAEDDSISANTTSSQQPAGEVPASSNDSLEALDDLIRQARQRAIPAHEALLRRLQTRKEIGDAVKETLTVADEVAKFGNAGVQLLNDANLEKVIGLLIEDRRRAELELLEPNLPLVLEPVHQSIEASADERSIDEFVAVFVQHTPLPLRVGLRNRRTGEFLIVRAGETKRIRDSDVRLLRISDRQGEQEAVFEVNGEEWRANIR